MAGGTAEILLPAMSDEIVESWRRIVSTRSKSEEGDDFWVVPPHQLGETTALPFFWSTQSETDELWIFEGVPEAVVAVQEHFGFRPAASIGLGAMCRGRSSDHVMAGLACEFLSKYESVLLLHGLLSPTLETNGWRSWSRCPPAVKAMQFMEEVGTLGGLILAVPIEDEPSYHAVNLGFLERWMSHPAFHFVN